MFKWPIVKSTRRHIPNKGRDLQKRSILSNIVVNLDYLPTYKKLHDEARRHDRGYTKLHDSTSTRSQDHAHPVQRIGSCCRMNTIERKLTAHEEDEETDDRVESLFSERDSTNWRLNLRKKREKRSDKMKDTKVSSHSSSHG